MLRKSSMWIFIGGFLIGLATVYAGAAWGVAWLLDTVFLVAVNYTVFVLFGLVLFALTVIPFVVFGMIAKQQQDRIDKVSNEINPRDW